MTKCTIGTVDVTEHVKTMFDVLVSSLDWGSGFLSVEDVESIMIVGELLGIVQWDTIYPMGDSYKRLSGTFHEKVAKWQKQIKARVQAMKEGEENGDGTTE